MKKLYGNIIACIDNGENRTYDESTFKWFDSRKELKCILYFFVWNRYYSCCYHYRKEEWCYNKFKKGKEILIFESIFNPNHKVIIEYDAKDDGRD